MGRNISFKVVVPFGFNSNKKSWSRLNY
jgi:hypothetical protein